MDLPIELVLLLASATHRGMRCEPLTEGELRLGPAVARVRQLEAATLF